MKSKKERLALKIERAKAAELALIYSFAVDELEKLVKKGNPREIHTGIAEIRDFVRCERKARGFLGHVFNFNVEIENGLR